MDELNTVYISNFKLDITDREIGSFLLFMGYENFVVQLGIRTGSLSTKRWAFCFVEFENLIDAKNLRNELLEVSAQIGKCMPHRYSQCERGDWVMYSVRQPMIFSENQQSPAQAILYGMKHDPHTANAICRIKIIHCKQWTPMHFSMHYNADPGRPWNNTPGLFRVETNGHQ